LLNSPDQVKAGGKAPSCLSAKGQKNTERRALPKAGRGIGKRVEGNVPRNDGSRMNSKKKEKICSKSYESCQKLGGGTKIEERGGVKPDFVRHYEGR